MLGRRFPAGRLQDITVGDVDETVHVPSAIAVVLNHPDVLLVSSLTAALFF
jgi:hypothetical protein